MRASATGDQGAFAEIMARHEDRIFALALRMTGNRSDALDATQDAFIAAWKRAGSFREEAAVGTWLFRIGINASTDLLRKRSRLPAPEATLAEPSVEGEPDMGDTIGLRADLSAALNSLPDEYREAVTMHDIAGFGYEDIARATKAPLGTVKSRISRGRRLLAGMLEQRPGTQTSKEQDG